MKILFCIMFALLTPGQLFADELPRLEVKGEISHSNTDPDKVALWFHCSRWKTEKENFQWQLVISSNGRVIKKSPIGVTDGPLNAGFSGGLDGDFADVPLGEYSVVGVLGELKTNTVNVKVVN